MNRKLHPFKEFTRPVFRVDDRSLDEKAEVFHQDIMTNWMFGPAGEFYWSMKPNDLGDAAIWQGMALFTYAARNDEGMAARLIQGIDHLITLGKTNRIARGVDLNPHFGGKYAVDPSRKHYNDGEFSFIDDVSESSMIGILFGLYGVKKFFPNTLLETHADRLLMLMAEQVIKDGYRLINEDGTPAKFGDLRPSIWTAPIRIGTLAALLLLAYRASGSGDLLSRYQDIVRKHYGSLTHLETHVLSVHPYYQDILAYMVYAMLVDMDNVNPNAVEGFSSAWGHLFARTNHEGNSFYIYLRHIIMKDVGQDYLDQAEKTLHEFNSDPSKGRTGREPGSVKNSGGPFDDRPRFNLKTFKDKARQPVPVSLRAAADNYWQRDPYSLDGHSDSSHNRLDFLTAKALKDRAGV